MKGYRKFYLIVWVNYKHFCNSFVRQYFKASSDIIAVSFATVQLHRKGPEISVFFFFFSMNSITKSVIYRFNSFLKIPLIVQSFYEENSLNLPLIATEGISTVLDSEMYP